MRAVVVGLFAFALADVASAQWTNRYPAVPGYSHHIYLEGFNLPTASAGITDPAPSPDGRRLVFASKGWLWLYSLESGRARQITSGSGVDARPAWSPDGRAIAFVRDDSRETSIVTLDIATGAERVVAAEPGLELDPAFTPGGEAVVYAAAGRQGIGLSRLNLATGARAVIRDERGLAFAPQPSSGGLVYLAKDYDADEIRQRAADGTERVIASGAILSQTRPALSPDGRLVAATMPRDDGWDLVVIDVEDPLSTVRLLSGDAPALEPAWSSDGTGIYYSQADADERLRLWRVPAAGGVPTEVVVRAWDGAVEMGTLTVRTTLGGVPAPARLAIVAAGHPVFPEAQTWFDGENGMVYSYSPGEVTVEVAAGTVLVGAVQGIETPLVIEETVVAAGGSATVTIDLETVWSGDGWVSGDQHFHLNYGGPYALDLADLRPVLEGEGLDVGTPLVANLHTRYVDDERWGEALTDMLPILTIGQEIRSHFFGHVGLVGTETLFNPWIWGPGYPVFGHDDRENADATAHARREGGIATYVHPVVDRDPFAPEARFYVPISLVADGVLGDLDGLEIVCLWTDDLGTSELWYRLLNLGHAVVPMAGSDVMSNFYRTMAPGTARAYVQTGGDTSFRAYLTGLKAGRSFVTTGPLLDARIGGAMPGGVVKSGDVVWTLDLASATAVDRVEVIVNGEVVATEPGLAEPGRQSYRGTVSVPKAGWVAIRAVGDGSEGWPLMARYAYAHTAPVWIGEVGSADAVASRRSARELLGVLDASERQFEAAYEGIEAPAVRGRFQRARAELERRAR